MTVSKILLLAALCEVRGEVSGDCLDPALQSKGICAAALRHIDLGDGVRWNVVLQRAYMNTLSTLFSGWPKHSGNLAFPVPDPDRDSANHVDYAADRKYFAAYDNALMWYGEYGDMRRELLDYAIDALKKELMQ